MLVDPPAPVTADLEPYLAAAGQYVGINAFTASRGSSWSSASGGVGAAEDNATWPAP